MIIFPTLSLLLWIRCLYSSYELHDFLLLSLFEPATQMIVRPEFYFWFFNDCGNIRLMNCWSEENQEQRAEVRKSYFFNNLLLLILRFIISFNLLIVLFNIFFIVNREVAGFNSRRWMTQKTGNLQVNFTANFCMDCRLNEWYGR